MKPEILVALIAFFGALLTAVATLVINVRAMRIDLRKHLGELKQAYADKLLEKRIEVYPRLYELISDLVKIVQYERQNFTNQRLSQFKEQLDKWDSKNAIYLSTEAGGKLYDFRWTMKKDLLNKMSDERLKEIEDDEEYWDNLRHQLAKIEIALKHDLGIYVVDFSDFKKRDGTYKDIAKEYKSGVR